MAALRQFPCMWPESYCSTPNSCRVCNTVVTSTSVKSQESLSSSKKLCSLSRRHRTISHLPRDRATTNISPRRRHMRAQSPKQKHQDAAKQVGFHSSESHESHQRNHPGSSSDSFWRPPEAFYTDTEALEDDSFSMSPDWIARVFPTQNESTKALRVSLKACRPCPGPSAVAFSTNDDVTFASVEEEVDRILQDSDEPDCSICSFDADIDSPGDDDSDHGMRRMHMELERQLSDQSYSAAHPPCVDGPNPASLRSILGKLRAVRKQVGSEDTVVEQSNWNMLRKRMVDNGHQHDSRASTHSVMNKPIKPDIPMRVGAGLENENDFIGSFALNPQTDASIHTKQETQADNQTILRWLGTPDQRKWQGFKRLPETSLMKSAGSPAVRRLLSMQKRRLRKEHIMKRNLEMDLQNAQRRARREKALAKRSKNKEQQRSRK